METDKGPTRNLRRRFSYQIARDVAECCDLQHSASSDLLFSVWEFFCFAREYLLRACICEGKIQARSNRYYFNGLSVRRAATRGAIMIDRWLQSGTVLCSDVTNWQCKSCLERSGVVNHGRGNRCFRIRWYQIEKEFIPLLYYVYRLSELCYFFGIKFLAMYTSVLAWQKKYRNCIIREFFSESETIAFKNRIINRKLMQKQVSKNKGKEFFASIWTSIYVQRNCK